MNLSTTLYRRARFSCRPFAGLVISALLLLDVQHASATETALLWDHGSLSTGSCSGDAIAVDGAGGVVVVGQFQGTVNVGGGDLVSAGLSDIFMVKYDASGAHQWSRRLGGSGNDVPKAVVTDNLNNIVVTGYFSGTTNLGGADLVSAGADDIFLAKYTSAGNQLWSKRFGSFVEEQGLGLAIDTSGGVVYSSGNIVITGRFGGSVDFGGGALTPVGQTDLFLVRFYSDGFHFWSKRFGSALDDFGYDVSINSTGNEVLTGSFQSTINFGGSNLTSSGSRDIFIAQFNYIGGHQWSKRFGGSGADEGLGIAIQGGATVATGYFTGLASFGGDLFDAGTTNHAFLAAYDFNGFHKWSHDFGNSNGDTKGMRVVVDASNNVLLGGFMAPGTMNFGGADLNGQGLSDLFLAKFNNAGVHQWSMSAGTPHYQETHGVALDASHHALETGFFVNNVDLGGGNLLASGSSEAFVAKFAEGIDEPVITAISDIGNDQGRKVKVVFQRSAQDDDASGQPVTKYESYRRIDSPPQTAAGTLAAALAHGWTQVGVVESHGEGEYSIDVPTIGDSTVTLGQYFSVFKIRAATAEPTAFYDSDPDSGFSIDNLAPGIPSNLAYTAGTLSWHESTAADFDFFTVYGSNASSFASATLIDYSVSTAMSVGASPYVYYFVTATDFSGNEGAFARVNTLSSAGGTPRDFVLSLSAYPNPFNPRTTIRYTLPSRGNIAIEVYDAQGGHVATLLDKEQSAGSYTTQWGGTDDRGVRVGSGIYFARITHEAGTKSYKLVLLK